MWRRATAPLSLALALAGCAPTAGGDPDGSDDDDATEDDSVCRGDALDGDERAISDDHDRLAERFDVNDDLLRIMFLGEPF